MSQIEKLDKLHNDKASYRIELDFPEHLTRLSGYAYGMKVYQKQIKPHFNSTEVATLVFPEHVERVAIGFVQGVISELGNDFEKFFNVSGNSRLTERFSEAVHY